MLKTDQSRYAQRGVSSGKEEVHAAVANLDKGLYPGAFCKILPDILGGDPQYCNVQHADGAGTKAGLAYLACKTMPHIDEARIWADIAQDSLVMNLDDVGCVGGLGPLLVSMTVGRNKHLISGAVIAALVDGCQRVCALLSKLGIPCHFSGGETADIGDLVRTITVDNTITIRFHRGQVIDASRITAPALIVGFSSTGQANWESGPNSGMGANGLTNAKHDVLYPEYRKHKETYAPETKPSLIYCGDHKLAEPLYNDNRFTIAKALLSPTRTYLPLIARLVQVLGPRRILGLIHCSGGGQTKIGNFGQGGIKFVKDNLFPTPPLFQMLQQARELPLREMYQSYNMGHRLEAVVRTESEANVCIRAARVCGIDAKIIGQVVPFEDTSMRQVEITTDGETITYPPVKVES